MEQTQGISISFFIFVVIFPFDFFTFCSSNCLFYVLQSPPSGEIAHEEAVTIIKKIEKRLMGHPINQEDLGLPLSVEGQVYQQIQEATSAKNLSQVI